jgi:dihydrofolate reductase
VRSSRSEGIDSVIAQAKAAAGDGGVVVQSAYTAQRTLEASVLDELLICHVPVLFGAGRRLFDVLPSRIESEIVRVSIRRRRLASASAVEHARRAAYPVARHPAYGQGSQDAEPRRTERRRRT